MALGILNTGLIDPELIEELKRSIFGQAVAEAGKEEVGPAGSLKAVAAAEKAEGPASSGITREKLQDRLPPTVAPPPTTTGMPSTSAPAPFKRVDLNPLEQIINTLSLGSYGQGRQLRQNEDDALATKNATYKALVGRGIDDGVARAILADPGALRQVMVALSQPQVKAAPTLVEVPGAYGQNQKMFVNKEGKLEPISKLMAEQGGAPAAGPPIVAPAPAATPVSPTLGAPPAAPMAPAAASPAPVLGTTEVVPALPEGMVVGAGVPKPPEGYVHKLAPGGKGFLYNRDGTPVFEPKAEADARAKGTEKKVLDIAEQEAQSAGVREIIANARKLPQIPGFEQGLAISAYGMNVPFIGLTNPVKEFSRIADRNAPEFAASDELIALQNRLNLIVARPLMKGQGAVTEGERELISKAIGELGKAGSAADFQFRLNSVEGMIEAMNTGKKGAVLAAVGKDYRPTVTELNEIVRGNYSNERVEELARKYNVDPVTLHAYAFELAGRAKK